MLPQVHTSKISLKYLNRTPWPPNLPEGKFINPYFNSKLLQDETTLFFEDNLQEHTIKATLRGLKARFRRVPNPYPA